MVSLVLGSGEPSHVASPRPLYRRHGGILELGHLGHRGERRHLWFRDQQPSASVPLVHERDGPLGDVVLRGQRLPLRGHFLLLPYLSGHVSTLHALLQPQTDKVFQDGRYGDVLGIVVLHDRDLSIRILQVQQDVQELEEEERHRERQHHTAERRQRDIQSRRETEKTCIEWRFGND